MAPHWLQGVVLPARSPTGCRTGHVHVNSTWLSQCAPSRHPGQYMAGMWQCSYIVLLMYFYELLTVRWLYHGSP